MIETIDVSKYNSTTYTSSRNPSSELGKDDFLKLLTTQLKNQDPMNPMEDTEFIGQMAQFSSLEQMLNIQNKVDDVVTALSGNSTTQAMMYLGTTVTAKNGEGDTVTGLVEMVGFDDGTPYLKVGDEAFKLDEVKLVSATYN